MTTRKDFDEWYSKKYPIKVYKSKVGQEAENEKAFKSATLIGFTAGRHSADDLIRRMKEAIISYSREHDDEDELISEAQDFMEDK
jgi:hypothetical protein